MKTRRILCIAFALCLLCTAALADGYSTSAAPVNIMTKAVTPFHWEVQLKNGSPIAWNVQYLFDGRWDTYAEYVGWNNEALDDIPEITLYFNNATIKDIWFRNRLTSDDPEYKLFARMYRIEVTIWVGDEEEPRGPYIFNKLPDVCDPTILSQTMIDGYQLLSLPQIFR